MWKKGFVRWNRGSGSGSGIGTEAFGGYNLTAVGDNASLTPRRQVAR